MSFAEPGYSGAMDDFAHMHHALTLAQRALGQTAPNPAVGCVIVKDGVVMGRGRTAKGGRPHAETIALAQAGEAARGATAYVTLEPCAHFGKTPPCADALVAAGVARVVIATADPDPRVNGHGIARLRAAAIDVVTGICETQACEINAGFFRKLRENRPLVTLKIAQSADGKTITAPGESPWITGERARAFGHLLRAKHDAILVGIGTVLADDPLLDCRLPGLEDRSPIRVVLDSRLRMPPESKLIQSARRFPTWIYTPAKEGGERLAGVEVVHMASQGRVDIGLVLADLAARGITRLLVEGGATMHAAFLKAGLVDRMEVFTSPAVLGPAAGGEVEGLIALTQGETPRFVATARRSLGPDLLVSYARTD